MELSNSRLLKKGERSLEVGEGDKVEIRYKFIDDSKGIKPLVSPLYPTRYSPSRKTFFHNQRKLEKEAEKLFEFYESQEGIPLQHKTVGDLGGMSKQERDRYLNNLEEALTRREYRGLYEI